MNLQVDERQRLAVDSVLPMPVLQSGGADDLEDRIEDDPEVVAAREEVAAAEAKVREAMRGFGPSVSLFARRDYLGQSLSSFGDANRHIAPFDYQYGISFQQPLGPFASETAQVGKAHAELRKAQAEYQKARLDVDARLRDALSARREAEASYTAARLSLVEAEQVLSLTQSLYHAGRTDLDNVERAEMDRDKAAADVKTFESKRAAAEWLAARTLEPRQFPALLLRQLHLITRDEHLR